MGRVRALPPRLRALAAGAVLLTVGALAVLGATLAGGADEAPSTAALADHPGAQLLQNPLPNPEATGFHGAVLAEPIPRPDFALTDTDGGRFDFAEETAGEPTLLYVGYTSCPDICPAHLAQIAGAMAEAGLDTDELRVVFVTADPARDDAERLDTDELRVVFVTADPARDDAERLERYLAAFDDGFTGLTGSPEEVDAALAALGQPAAEVFGERPDGSYEVTHPSQVLAFGPDDRARLVFPFGTSREGWVADLPRLVAGEVPS